MNIISKIGILSALSIWFNANAQQNTVSTAFTTGNHQPVGVAIATSGRTFVSFPNWLPAFKISLAEVLADGRLKPFPDASWNNWLADRNDKTQFVCVQNVVADQQNNLWVLDPANPQLGEARQGGTKLVKINLGKDLVERVYYFPDSIAGRNSFLNDVRIDEKHGRAYFADPAQKAIIVLDLESGASRKVLNNHATLKADPNFVFRLNGIEMRDSKGNPFSSNINGIAITKDFEWFYFRAETDVKLYRIATRYLSDFSLSDEVLASHIQDMGTVGQSNGIIADSKGNIYLTAAMDKAIKRVSADGTITILAQGKDFEWPDTFALSADEGYLLVSISQINRMTWFNNGKDQTKKPFKVLKIKL